MKFVWKTHQFQYEKQYEVSHKKNLTGYTLAK